MVMMIVANVVIRVHIKSDFSFLSHDLLLLRSRRRQNYCQTAVGIISTDNLSLKITAARKQLFF